MTEASDFDDLYRAIPYPEEPKLFKPDRKNYATNKEYHLAVAEAEDAFEESQKAYKALTEEYSINVQELNEQFWAWALGANELSELPENVRNLAKMHAWEEGHAHGYESVDRALEDISSLVLEAFEAGKGHKQ